MTSPPRSEPSPPTWWRGREPQWRRSPATTKRGSTGSPRRSAGRSVTRRRSHELAHMSVDESGIGDREGRVAKRFKIHGILRDALRMPSIAIIARDPAKGLVQYAKPAGVIASIVPMTNPELTPPGHGDLRHQGLRRGHLLAPPAHQADHQRGRPHPPSGDGARGARADVFQCVEQPSIPLSQQLMKRTAT